MYLSHYVMNVTYKGYNPDEGGQFYVINQKNNLMKNTSQRKI